MIQNKIHYLSEENLALKKQLKHISNIASFPQYSQVAQRSLLFQLSQDLSSARQQVQSLKCELLLERQTRANEVSTLKEEIEELNQYILILRNENLAMDTILEGVKKGSTKNNHTKRWNCWRKESLESGAQFQSPLHELNDPLAVFDLMDEFFKCFGEKKKNRNLSVEKSLETEMDFDLNLQDLVNLQIDEAKIKPTTVSDNTEGRWYERTESKQFYKRPRGVNMHLQLEQAKKGQRRHYNQGTQKKDPYTNVKLLKESYLELVIDFTAVTKEVKILKDYIQELQSRNAIIVKSYFNSQ